MIIHAFFKALLFLGAGAVIHGLHDEQDMKRMGGLRKYMPHHLRRPSSSATWPSRASPPSTASGQRTTSLHAAWHKSPALWAVGVVTAGLTAYYMSRQVVLVWFGKARWEEGSQPVEAAAVAAAGDGRPPHGAAAGHGEHGEASGHGVEPHESPWTMTIPLIVLAGASMLGGLLNLPFGGLDLLNRWLEPVLPRHDRPGPHVDTAVKVGLILVTVAICVVGIIARPSSRGCAAPSTPPSSRPLLEHAWYNDDEVSRLRAGTATEAADFAAYDVDKGVIDGAVNGVARLTASIGRKLRQLQTGYVRNYALGIAGGSGGHPALRGPPGRELTVNPGFPILTTSSSCRRSAPSSWP